MKITAYCYSTAFLLIGFGSYFYERNSFAAFVALLAVVLFLDLAIKKESP